MAKSAYEPPQPSFLHKLALSREKARFEQFMEISQPPARVMKNGFLSGAARTSGFVVGAGLVAGLVVALLGLLGYLIPGAIGEFLLGINRSLGESAGWR